MLIHFSTSLRLEIEIIYADFCFYISTTWKGKVNMCILRHSHACGCIVCKFLIKTFACWLKSGDFQFDVRDERMCDSAVCEYVHSLSPSSDMR